MQNKFFKGGVEALQLTPFKNALKEANLEALKVSYLSTSDVRTWSPTTVIDWLFDSDIHVILTHMHQSLNWNISELLEQLNCLSYHYGWPGHASLNYPVFLQDKYRYLSILPDITNESYAFQLKKRNLQL